MFQPFATVPQLSSHFPDPDDLRIALQGESKSVREVVARLWITEGFPAAFQHMPSVYEDMRGWLANRLKIHPKEITLIGSARAGYSLSPPPEYGRRFSDNSDLDLSIISGSLFASVSATFSKFAADYKDGVVKPKNANQEKYWPNNINFGLHNIPKGFFDPDKIPNLDRYPLAKEVSGAMWRLHERLKVTPGAPIIRGASVRIYKDWNCFLNQVTLNLKAAVE